MNLTPSSEKTQNNLGNACKSKQASDHQHGPNTTPLRPNKSEPRSNNSNLMVVKLSQNQNGVVTGPFTPPSMISSPRFKSTPATSWLRLKNITPNRSTLQRSCVTHNPFETGVLDSLSKHVFSPNVFRVPTPDKKTPKFQWSIDDIAILRPTDIDESSAMDSLMPTEHNAEFEEVAQRAIDEYFSSQVIAPSPWSNSAKKGQSTKGSSSKNRLLFQSPLADKSTTTTTTSDLQAVDSGVGTQTMISIPPNFDFDAFAGGRFCLSESKLNELNSGSKPTQCEDEEAEGLNNLSLRRKLFFHHQMFHPSPPNPQELSEDEEDAYDEEEGVKGRAGKTGFEEDMDIIAGDGSYEMYASSPIHLRSESPRLARSPFGGHHQFLASPEMSPISKLCSSDSSQLPTPVRPIDFDHHTKVIDQDATSKRFPASIVRKITTMPNILLPKADTFHARRHFVQTSDETGIESLGIEDHGKSIGFHETMMDVGSTLGDTQHADTGYASNNLGISSHSNLTNQFYKLSQQDMSGLCEGFEIKNPQHGFVTTKLDEDRPVLRRVDTYRDGRVTNHHRSDFTKKEQVSSGLESSKL